MAYCPLHAATSHDRGALAGRAGGRLLQAPGSRGDARDPPQPPVAGRAARPRDRIVAPAMRPWRAFARRLVVVAVVLSSTPPARGQQGSVPVPVYAGYVTDDADVIGDERQTQLDL